MRAFCTFWFKWMGLFWIGIPSIGWADPLNLSQVLSLAFTHNPALQLAQLDSQGVDYDLHVAQSQQKPRFELGAAYAYHRNPHHHADQGFEQHWDITPHAYWPFPWGGGVELSSVLHYPLGLSGYSPHGLTLNVRQPLWKGLGRWVNQFPIEQALRAQDIQKWRLQETRSAIVFDVVLAFIQVKQRADLIQIHQQMLGQQKRWIEQLVLNIKMGRMAANELAAAKAQLSHEENALLEAKMHYEHACASLWEIVGCDPQKGPFEFSRLLKPIVFNTQAQAVEAGLASSKMYAILHLNLKQLEQQMRFYTHQKRIDVHLNAQTTWLYDSHTSRQHFPYGVKSHQALRIEMQWPLGRQVEANQAIFNHQLAITRSKIQLNTFKQQLKNRIIQQFQRMERLQNQIRLKKQNVQLNRQGFEQALAKLNAGRTSVFEVTSMKERWTQAKMDYAQFQTQYLSAWAQFNLMTGRLLVELGVEADDHKAP